MKNFLKPLEWVCLVFVATIVLVVALAGGQPFALWDDLVGVRGRRVLVVLLAVGVLKLGLAFVRLPWPAGQQMVRQKLWLALPVPLIPLVAVWVNNPVLAEIATAGRAGEHAHAGWLLIVLGLQVTGTAAASLGLWLAVGLHLKQHSRFVAGRFFPDLLGGITAQAREWLPFVVLVQGYVWMGTVMDLTPQVDRDDWMIAADRALFFGADPTQALQKIIWQPLTEWLAFSYSFYGVLYPLALGAVYLKAGSLALRRALFSVGTGLAIAYASYSLVPVKGPMQSRTFEVPLHLEMVSPVKAGLDNLRITWDCFPSMHTCATLLLAVYLWRYARGVFWATLPVVISIPFACVYLRYHYVVDLLAGVALALAMLALTQWVFRIEEPLEPRPVVCG